MKHYFIYLVICFSSWQNLMAQCDSYIHIDHKYGNMPPLAYATQTIEITDSSTLPTQVHVLDYRAGQGIDIENFDSSPGSSIKMEISQSLSGQYKVGAWYHTAWFMDNLGDPRFDGYYNYVNLPSYKKIADVWNGVRNIAMNQAFYASHIPEVSNESYRMAHTPVLGFYDISDKRVMEKQIAMASSRGLSFFGFYNYYDKSGYELCSSRAVDRFKKSSNKNLMKYMVSLFQPKEVVGLDSNFIANLTNTVVNQLADNNNPTMLDPSYLTNNNQPFIALSSFDLLVGSNTVFNQLAYSLREGIKTRFGIYPIVLLVTNTDLVGSRAVNLMQQGNGYSPHLYDGYIGFQHLIPRHDTVNTDYDNLSYQNAFSSTQSFQSPKMINDALIASAPSVTQYNIPSVSVGFDARPWYPISPEVNHYSEYYFKNATPDAFARVLNHYKSYIDEHFQNTHNMLMCYAWNEWGESGTLEPSEEYGYGYLDAIKNTFCMTTANSVDLDLHVFSMNYEQWKNNLTTWGAFSSDFDADPDGDGLQNILEYVLDLNPTTPDSITSYTTDQTHLPYYNPDTTNPTLIYQHDFKKNDVIYFVEDSENESQPSVWYLYNDTNFNHEEDSNWTNYVTPPAQNQTVETRKCAPRLHPRADTNDHLIKRLRLVIGYIDPATGVTHRYFFPPQNSAEFKTNNTSQTTKKATIFPNPSKNGLFNIISNDDSMVQLEVTNFLGQKVPFESVKNDSLTILDLSGKTSGIYLVKVIQKGISQTYKVVID